MSKSPSCPVLPLRNKSLALGVIVVLISSCSSRLLAQVPDSPTTLPNAPSAVAAAHTASGALPPTARDFLTLHERANLYIRSVFNIDSITGPAFGAAIGQWEGEPPEWQGSLGYGKRFASGETRHIIGETIRFGFAAYDGEDPRYFLSQNRGIWARSQHALVSAFVSQRSGGRRVPAFSRFLGAYGAAFISNTWYPKDEASAGDAAMRGSTALGSTVGFNLLREFVPFFRRDPR